MLARTLAACAALSLFCAPVAEAQAPQHPLDPLGWQEYWTVLEVLKEAGHLDSETRFSRLQLHEPDKSLVWNWKSGNDFPRSAFAVVRDGPRTYEAVIDISARRLTSWSELTGAQPQWLDEEFGSGAAQVKENPEFIAAMERRGITDLMFVECHAIPPGYFGTPGQQGRRIG